MSEDDWYVGVLTCRYPKAATMATAVQMAMVSFRRHRMERNSLKVSGQSLSRSMRRPTQDTAWGPLRTVSAAGKWQVQREGPHGPEGSCRHLAGLGGTFLYLLDDIGDVVCPVLPRGHRD